MPVQLHLSNRIREPPKERRVERENVTVAKERKEHLGNNIHICEICGETEDSFVQEGSWLRFLHRHNEHGREHGSGCLPNRHSEFWKGRTPNYPGQRRSPTLASMNIFDHSSSRGSDTLFWSPKAFYNTASLVYRQAKPSYTENYNNKS